MTNEQSRRVVTTIWNKNFICVTIANFMLCLSHNAINPLFASYLGQLGAGAQLTGFLIGIIYGISFAMRPITGPMMTRIDKRKLLIFVFVVGVIASLGYAVSSSIAAFTVFRFLSGIQYSLIGGLLLTLSADSIPEAKMASGIGIYGVGAAIGTAVAPAIGIELLNIGTEMRDESFGYDLTFIFAAAVFALAIIPSCIIDPDRKTKEEIASTGAWYKNIFSSHAFPSTIMMFFVTAPYAILNNYMVEFGKGNGITNVSMFFTILALMLIVSRPLSGHLTDKFGIEKILIPAMGIMAFSMFFIGSSTTLPMLLVGAAIVAIGFGSSQPSVQAMCMMSEPPIRRGVASNTLYMGMDLGFFFGPLVGGYVHERFDYAIMYKMGIIPVLVAIACLIIFLPNYKRRQIELRKLSASK